MFVRCWWAVSGGIKSACRARRSPPIITLRFVATDPPPFYVGLDVVLTTLAWFLSLIFDPFFLIVPARVCVFTVLFFMF